MFKNLLESVKNEPLLFHCAVSNPPYQRDSGDSAIFNEFQDILLETAQKTSMIYMASAWWNGNRGLGDFRKRLLENPRLRFVEFFSFVETVKNLFEDIGLAGGVAIIYCNNLKNRNFILKEYATKKSVFLLHSSREILPIKASQVAIAKKVSKILKDKGFSTINERGEIRQNEFRLFVQDFEKMRLRKVSESFNNFDKKHFIKIYANISGDKGQRSGYYLIPMPNKKPPNRQFKVIFRQTIIEKEVSSFYPILLDEHTTWGRAAVSLAFFNSREEAENFLKYAQTKFFEGLIRLGLSGKMKTLGMFVPDFKDYTSNNPLINWALDLDVQLFKLFKLNQKDFEEHLLLKTRGGEEN